MRRVRQRHIDKWQRRWQQNSESVARERERQRERRRHNRVERETVLYGVVCVCGGCVSVCLLLLLVMLFLVMSVCVLCERVFSVHVNELRVSVFLYWCFGLPLLSWELYACMYVCVCVCDVDVKRSTQRTQWKNWRDGNSGGDNDDARKYLIKTKKSI